MGREIRYTVIIMEAILIAIMLMAGAYSYFSKDPTAILVVVCVQIFYAVIGLAVWVADKIFDKYFDKD